MRREIILIILFFYSVVVQGQLAEVRANYNSVGDVDFVAYNNTPAPLFLNIDFADLENTTFNENLPYIKLLQPGFNTLFTLYRDPGAEPPRFNHQIKVFKSNPWAFSDLNHPYLIPLAPGSEVTVLGETTSEGFTALPNIPSWHATGFMVNPNQEVFAARTGIIVEVVGQKRNDDPQTWYHNWTNAVTVLQPDGTLICYKNIVNAGNTLKTGEKVFAGQVLGKVAPGRNQLIVVIYQHSLNSSDLRFIIPKFISEQPPGVLLSTHKYKAVHPKEIRGLEMTSREMRRNLK